MRSLVRRPAALGAVLLALGVAALTVPTCGGAPDQVRPIVLDGGDHVASPVEDESDTGPTGDASSGPTADG